MELLCMGLSHKSAPLHVREKLALPPEEQQRLLDDAERKLADSFRSLAADALKVGGDVFLDSAPGQGTFTAAFTPHAPPGRT